MIYDKPEFKCLSENPCEYCQSHGTFLLFGIFICPDCANQICLGTLIKYLKLNPLIERNN